MDRKTHSSTDEVATLLRRAAVLRAAGKLDLAESRYLNGLQLAPANGEIHYLLGQLYYQAGNRTAAVSHLEQAATHAPLSLATHLGLGEAYLALGRWIDAIAALNRALAIDPNCVPGRLNLANALVSSGQLQEAEVQYRIGLAGDPDNADIHSNLACLLNDLRRYAEAEPHARAAVARAPNHIGASHNLCLALGGLGLFEEAVTVGLRAVELNADPSVRHALGIAQLRIGDYHNGWRNIEAREAMPMFAHKYTAPKWDGGPLNGETLLVRAEGGFGDAIQFARFLPFAAQRANGPVVFACPSALIDLLRDAVGPVSLVDLPPNCEPPPVPHDFQVGLQSLPAILGATEKTIPSGRLSMRVPEAATEAWRERLAGSVGLKVGLCWAGAPGYSEDRYRSMRLEVLEPLTTLKGVTFVSLQIGPAADEIQSGSHGLEILHVAEELSPFAKAAELIRELDLVISVDTSIAHLAGALGVETWLLLPFVPHWVWNVNSPYDTVWYPRHRLFRQERPYDWAAVIDRVRSELSGKR